MAERRLDNRRRIEATRRVAFPSNRKPPIHREQKKAPGVPGLKGDQLRSLAAARRFDTIRWHKSGKARIA